MAGLRPRRESDCPRLVVTLGWERVREEAFLPEDRQPRGVLELIEEVRAGIVVMASVAARVPGCGVRWERSGLWAQGIGIVGPYESGSFHGRVAQGLPEGRCWPEEVDPRSAE